MIRFAVRETSSKEASRELAQPQNSEEIAATVAVGAGGYVFHEHHKKKESKKEVKELHM